MKIFSKHIKQMIFLEEIVKIGQIGDILHIYMKRKLFKGFDKIMNTILLFTVITTKLNKMPKQQQNAQILLRRLSTPINLKISSKFQKL